MTVARVAEFAASKERTDTRRASAITDHDSPAATTWMFRHAAAVVVVETLDRTAVVGGLGVATTGDDAGRLAGGLLAASAGGTHKLIPGCNESFRDIAFAAASGRI